MKERFVFNKTNKLKAEDITPNAKVIISPILADDYRREGINLEKDRFLSPDELNKLEQDIEKISLEYDKLRNNPYHNYSSHEKEVAKRCQALINVSSKSEIKEDSQLIILIGLMHDIDHCGKAIKTVDDCITPDEIKNSARSHQRPLNNEEWSCVLADKIAKKHGLSVHQRIKIQGGIVGTTFGNKNIKPETDLEKLIAIADIASFINSPLEWFKESILVLKEESSKNKQIDFNSWLKSQRKFLYFAQSRMTIESENIWGEKLNNIINIVEDIIINPLHPLRNQVELMFFENFKTQEISNN